MNSSGDAASTASTFIEYANAPAMIVSDTTVEITMAKVSVSENSRKLVEARKHGIYVWDETGQHIDPDIRWWTVDEWTKFHGQVEGTTILRARKRPAIEASISPATSSKTVR